MMVGWGLRFGVKLGLGRQMSQVGDRCPGGTCPAFQPHVCMYVYVAGRRSVTVSIDSNGE